jgi:hypothetical protein
VERFTRVRPFSIREWEKTLDRPTITFIWRDDRIWCGTRAENIMKFLKKIGRRVGLFQNMTFMQKRRVIGLANAIKRDFPGMDFAVAGIGSPGGLPEWITDLRTMKIDGETERRWCERYAKSHVVIGVHGSNMLLPSAHAGTVIELLPFDRWGNMLQDLLFRDIDGREMLYLYRLIPCSASPGEVAGSAMSLLNIHDIAMLQMGKDHCKHNTEDARIIHEKWKLI